MAGVPIDLLLSTLLGLAFAACARRQLIEANDPAARFFEGALGWELLAVVSFVALARGPVALYFAVVHTDWSFLYLVEPSRLPTGTAVLLLLAHLACVLGGWGAGLWLARRRLDGALAGAIGGVALAALALALGWHERLGSDTTFAGYRDGLRPPLGAAKLPWLLATTTLGQLVSAAGVGWMLLGQGPSHAGARARDDRPAVTVPEAPQGEAAPDGDAAAAAGPE